MTMPCCYEYSTRQRIAFCIVGVGLALCIVGCASPFWLSGKVTENDVDSYLAYNLNRIDNQEGKMAKFDVDVGLWWYCIGQEGREHVCFKYPSEIYNEDYKDSGPRDDSRAYVFFVRMLMCGCLFLTMVGLLKVFFYCSTCCSDGHTLGYGLLFFASGFLGFAAVFILTFKIDVLLSIPESRISFGWALPVFLTGNGLIHIGSVFLCVPSCKKDSFKCEMMVSGDIPQYQLIGQFGAFEPLPDPTTITITKNI